VEHVLSAAPSSRPGGMTSVEISIDFSTGHDCSFWSGYCPDVCPTTKTCIKWIREPSLVEGVCGLPGNSHLSFASEHRDWILGP
jgi:hypothetical protein